MASWEDELDLDLSHIWQPEPKAPEPHAKPDDAPDDLAFPSQAPAPAAETAGAGAALSQRTQSLQEEPQTSRVTSLSQQEPQVRVTRLLQVENAVVTRLQAENAAVTRLQSGNGNLEDIADAPTQVASLSAEPFVSRGGGSTVPLATERLAPLPLFQAVVSGESGDTVPIATQRLVGSEHSKQRYPKGSGGDIRNYFSQGGGPRKKARIPGPVGDLLLKNGGEEERGGGVVVDERVEEGGDRVFRKGAWMCALQSLNVEEFDPARYAILNVTASSIGSSRLNQRVPHFVAVIKELTPNVFGDAAVILKDPTGTVAGMMNNKVFSNTDFARAISPGAVLVLKQVAVFSPSAHYLNITIGNVVQVFPANTDLRQGSAPKQEPLSLKKKQPPQPKRQPSPPQLLQPLQPQPTPLPSPPQQAQPLLPSPPQQAQPLPSPPQQAQPLPSPPQQAQPQPSPPPREPTKATAVAAKTASWDLLSPSPPKEPSPPQEPSEGIAAAAKMAGWGDLTDDMEALLNEDVDDFYK